MAPRPLSEEELVARVMAEFDAEEFAPTSPRRSRQMPQPPNMKQLLQQAQKMQAGHDGCAGGRSRTKLVEASAGGGMVTVVVTGDLA